MTTGKKIEKTSDDKKGIVFGDAKLVKEVEDILNKTSDWEEEKSEKPKGIVFGKDVYIYDGIKNNLETDDDIQAPFSYAQVNKMISDARDEVIKQFATGEFVGTDIVKKLVADAREDERKRVVEKISRKVINCLVDHNIDDDICAEIDNILESFRDNANRKES